MKILFYFGHPAQYLFLRETIRRLLLSEGNTVIILIKTKDVLEDLIKADGLEYRNVLPKQRGLSRSAVLFSLLKRVFILFPIIIRAKPSLLISTDATTAIIGKLLGIKRITITEDDYDVIKNLAILTYPFTSNILCPKVCNVGKYKNKKIGYDGYMKLGYLHPNVFNPDNDVLKQYNISEKFVLIRLVRLFAHHDFGILGMSEALLYKIIKICINNNYNVFISSEEKLDDKFSSYALRIKSSDMHHVLSQASLLISDSQSMSVEAAMLGVPSLRFSSFVGKISVLEELEHKYQLTFGINPSDPKTLLKKTQDLLGEKDFKVFFSARKAQMLSDKIDVTAFLVWFIENYPHSEKIMRENPDYQYNFK